MSIPIIGEADLRERVGQLEELLKQVASANNVMVRHLLQRIDRLEIIVLDHEKKEEKTNE